MSIQALESLKTKKCIKAFYYRYHEHERVDIIMELRTLMRFMNTNNTIVDCIKKAIPEMARLFQGFEDFEQLAKFRVLGEFVPTKRICERVERDQEPAFTEASYDIAAVGFDNDLSELKACSDPAYEQVSFEARVAEKTSIWEVHLWYNQLMSRPCFKQAIHSQCVEFMNKFEEMEHFADRDLHECQFDFRSTSPD